MEPNGGSRDVYSTGLTTGTFRISSCVELYYEKLSLFVKDRSAQDITLNRLVLIQGFASSGHAWDPVLDYLRTHQDGDLEVLIYDNRGIGKSSSPEDKAQYTTTIMARDALSLMDHLGWTKAHIAGFSMGGMIAMKLAALAPQRVHSLTVLGVTGGGMEVIPRRWRGIKLILRGIFGSQRAEARAYTDIKLHFSSATLKQKVPGHGNLRLQEILLAEYVDTTRLYGAQEEAGSRGHMHAVWTHRVTSDDRRTIKAGGFPVWFVHGRHDVLATPAFAEHLASKLGAPFITVNGAHLIARECAAEIGAFLHSIMHPRAQTPELSILRTLTIRQGSG